MVSDRERAARRRTVTRARQQAHDGRGRRDDRVDPSQGGGSGYPAWQRLRLLALPADAAPRAGDPHRTTLQRWRTQLALTGNVAAEAPTGGAPRKCSEMDVALVHVLQAMYPTMTNREMRNMLAHYRGIVFIDVDIVRMRKDYNPFATTSYQRLLVNASEASPILRNMWRHQPPPYGSAGVPLMKWIDIDEMGVHRTFTNRGMGYALVGRRPRATQVYEKDVLFTVVLGVSAGGECFYRIIKDGGINGARFIDYLQGFVFPYCGNHRVLMWDNLSAHLTAGVNAAVAAANGGTITTANRPPYTPHWAPIEFIFGVIEQHLRRFEGRSEPFEQLLRAAIRSAVTPVTCYNVFKHCGY